MTCDVTIQRAEAVAAERGEVQKDVEVGASWSGRLGGAVEREKTEELGGRFAVEDWTVSGVRF